MENEARKQSLDKLYETILKLETKEDCEAFFADLCTYTEVQNMADRVMAAKLLKEGQTYNEVIAKTNISSATLSRVSRSLKYGSGYKKFVD